MDRIREPDVLDVGIAVPRRGAVAVRFEPPVRLVRGDGELTVFSDVSVDPYVPDPQLPLVAPEYLDRYPRRYQMLFLVASEYPSSMSVLVLKPP